MFYVLEGEVRSTTGDIEAVVTQGGTVSLPKQQAHQFQVLSDLPAAPGLTTTFASWGSEERELLADPHQANFASPSGELRVPIRRTS